MSIDDVLRTGLPEALDDLRPDLDAELDAVLRRAVRRTRLRRTAYAAGVAAAGVAAAAAVTAVVVMDGDTDSRRSLEPMAPDARVRVLDSEVGSADAPAPLEPGRYAIPVFGADDDTPWGLVDVPRGWGQDRLHLATGPDLDPHLRRIEVLAVDRVAADPCEGSQVPVEPGVAPIVDALTGQRTVEPGSARPTAIDGYSGRLVRFEVPAGLDVSRCYDGESLRPVGLGGSWTSVYPGWTYRLWVLDVTGETVVVMAAHGPETSPAERAELTAMVEGIRFVPPR